MTRPLSWLLVLGSFWMIAARPVQGEFATFDLKVQSVTPTSATIDVDLQFNRDPGDTIEAIQLSVAGSDPFQGAQTDFSKFSFQLNSTTLPGWDELLPISSGLGLYAPDPLTGVPLSPSSSEQNLGVLTVDLTGIPAGRQLTITLADNPGFLGTDVGGMVDGTFFDSYAANGLLSFTQPNGVIINTVPAPASLTLTGLGGLILLGYRWRRRTSRESHS